MTDLHANWIAKCAERCVAKIEKVGLAQSGDELMNVAHQIAQSRPDELRQFVLVYPREMALFIPDLMILAWRIVGNEYKEDLAERASEEIEWLCDIDEARSATLALRRAQRRDG